MRPYYESGGVVIYHGDCREVLPALAGSGAELCVTDPPYGDTSLGWDVVVDGWVGLVAGCLAADASVWFFTSLRHLLAAWPQFAGWRFAQDVVWEKHNGSSLHNDRFRRVHEHAVQVYRGSWDSIYHRPPKTLQARSRVVRKQSRPAAWLGATGATTFVQPAGMTKLMRSVIAARSEHRRGHHPTQKPLAVVTPLIEGSCSPTGLVLDPFAGSGTTLVAAAQLGRKAIGVELSERYCEVAARRLAQYGLDLGPTAGVAR